MENIYKETKLNIETNVTKLVRDMDGFHNAEIEANNKTERALKTLLSLKEKFKNY
jgi:hypothetical protein